MPLVRASRKLVNALVMELVVMPDLGSGAAGCEGSSPSQSTITHDIRVFLTAGLNIKCCEEIKIKSGSYGSLFFYSPKISNHPKSQPIEKSQTKT